MSRIRNIVFAASATLVLISASAPAASASAVDVNRGACMSSIDPSQKPYQAPGQNGNGPLVIVNGRVNTAAGHEGGMGCTKDT